MWVSLLISVVIIFSTSESKAEKVIVHLNDTYGTIESPGYPNPYENDLDKTWVITTDPGYQIEIYFTTFDLEDSYDENLGGACVYDYVEIENWGKNIRFCGNNHEFPEDAPKPWQRFRSENNSMTVRFVSDYSNGFFFPFGFQAHFRKIDKDECAIMRQQVRDAFEDWDELVYCNHFCINVPGSYYCACRHGFELHENNHTCKASCYDQVITEDEGVITSPDYPAPYSRSTDCDWTIRVREGLSLNLQFNGTFEIENHFNHTDCVYDWLKLSYGSHEQTYCHGLPNNGRVIRTNIREARLDFHTDGALEEAGFKMIFTTTRTRCLQPRLAPRHGYKSRNLKGYYEFEDKITFRCQAGYTLTPPGGNVTKCQHNGVWSHSTPRCEIKICGRPSQLANVPYSRLKLRGTRSYTFRDSVEVKCRKWYKLDSGIPRWRCSEDGTWQPRHNGPVVGNPVPVCKPECGIKKKVRRKAVKTHISGGKKANPHEWPWMVFINFGYRRHLGADLGLCSGSLISPDYVLTAAHCVTGVKQDDPPFRVKLPNKTHVWVKVHDRQKKAAARSIEVEEIIRHPNYNPITQDFDVALLRLSQTLIMSNKLRPICLPGTAAEHDLLNLGNTTGQVAGWGKTHEHKLSSYILLYSSLPSIQNDECERTFSDFFQEHNQETFSDFSLTKNMFCAGFKTGSLISTCQGDSGGPFMVKSEESNRYYEMGVVSFGLEKIRCGIKASYSVFAKINRSISAWILSIIN